MYTPRACYKWTEDRKPLPLAAALVGKVGYRFVGSRRKAVVQDIGKYWDPQRLRARSITGELTWDAQQGLVHIDTPRSQAVVGFLSSQAHILARRQADEREQVWRRLRHGDVRPDSHPIRAARILVTAVGPVRKARDGVEKTSRTSRLGSVLAPQVARRGSGALLESVAGSLRIRSSQASAFKAWTLDVTGKRREQVPLTVESGAVVLKLQPEHKTVYYELAVE